MRFDGMDECLEKIDKRLGFVEDSVDYLEIGIGAGLEYDAAGSLFFASVWAFDNIAITATVSGT